MKAKLFFENAGLLNDKFKIIPLMYGSLGLEYITGENLDSVDIDVLIPQAFITEKWDELKSFLTENGYVLTNEREHTFQKDGIDYSYARFEELESFAQISLSDIRECRFNEIRFKILSLEQYLKVYTASSKDGYRKNVRQKKDAEKIAFIKSYIERT